MANEIITIAVIFALRLWSAWEHKKTSAKVNRIEISLNGELEKRLEEAREQGRQEERSKNKKSL